MTLAYEVESIETMRTTKHDINLLRRYIREAIDLGDIQFSPNRMDGVSRDEPNTPEEEVLNRALRRRLEDSSKISPEIAQQLSDLINSEKYGVRGSGFFQGPAAGVQLYRGHAFGPQWIDEHFAGGTVQETSRIDFMEKLKNVKPVTLSKPYVFEQFRGWSYNIEVAVDWAHRYTGKGYLGPERGDYGVILVINTDDVAKHDMLDLSAGLYKTDYGNEFVEESEVMNLVPITVTTAKIVKIVGN